MARLGPPPSIFSLLQTGAAVYILVTTAKDGRSVTSLERKIPLVTIKAVSMSNLRDDWMVPFLIHAGVTDLDDETFLGLTL
jgi:hypothetical protein